jgi:allantoinase
VAFWGGVVPGNTSELDALVDAGVRGFKCFLVPSGVEEFQHVGEEELREAMPILARRAVPLLVHAESPDRIEQAIRPTYEGYLTSRPPDAELEAVRMMIRLAREFGTRTHIVHVACADAVAEISRAKQDRVPISAETCPHYLTFAAEDIGEGATEFKCAPPIRDSHHRDALWRGLHSGALDLVASDHSPAPAALKCGGDFSHAWGGIASLELSLASVWSRSAGSVCDIARWMSAAPAALAGLARKGRIAPGYDADLIVFDPDAEWTVDPDRLQQRHKVTPYAGRRLRGAVRSTFLRGVRIWDEERLVTGGAGCLL